MNKAILRRGAWAYAGLALLLSACGGVSEPRLESPQTSAQATQPPVISSFTGVANNPNPLQVTFGWSISDPDSSNLTCELDTNNDGRIDHTIAPCTSSSLKRHSYSVAGTYNARLVVKDDSGSQTQRVIQVTVPASGGTNANPVISAFNVSFANGRQARFSWAISDPNNDALTCRLDVTSDGIFDRNVTGCTSSTTQLHTYPGFVNTYSARLVVEDGKGGRAERTIQVNVVPTTLTYDFTLSFRSEGNSISISNTITLTLQSNQNGVQTYTGSFPYSPTETYTGTLTVSGINYSLNINAPDVTASGSGTRNPAGRVTGTFTGTGVDAGTGTWSANPR